MRKVGVGKMLFTLLWVGIILYAVSNFYLSHKAEKRYQAAKERLESLGVPTMKEFLEEKKSKVPDEENFWKHPELVKCLNSKNFPKSLENLKVKEWQDSMDVSELPLLLSPEKGFDPLLLFNKAKRPLNSQEAAKKLLSWSQSEVRKISFLSEAFSRKKANVELTLNSAFWQEDPDLYKFSESVVMFCTERSVLYVFLKDRNAAFDELRILMNLTILLYKDSDYTMYSSGAFAFRAAASAIWYGVKASIWSEEQLTEIRLFFDEIKNPFDVRKTMNSNIVEVVDIVKRYKQNPQLFYPPKPTRLSWNDMDVIFNYYVSVCKPRYIHSSICATELERVCDFLERKNTRLFMKWKKYNKLAENYRPEDILIGYSYWKISLMLHTTVFFESNMSLYQSAIALYEFHKEQGVYPENLQQLIPDFLTESPMDYTSGKEIVYIIDPAGNPVLISYGGNGKFDSSVIKSGKDKGKVDISRRDIGIRFSQFTN